MSIKVATEVTLVKVQNIHSPSAIECFNNMFTEKIRFETSTSVFKAWKTTVYAVPQKLFAAGLIRYEA